jgi:pimeloyl-ACP methyl ester carboxylesterase
VPGGWVTVDVYGAADGPALVVVPGVLADAAAWSTVASGLNRWETVAVVNRRGRTPSSPQVPEYSLQTEIDDLEAVLQEFSEVRTLFGWSYGALIALHVTNSWAVPHLIAYEPIMRPFGASSLPHLRLAHEDADGDRTVEIALREVTGMDAASVAALRADDAVWTDLVRLGLPLYAETRAINEAAEPPELASSAARVDLIVGQRNRGEAPYGTSFENAARHVAKPAVHELAGQGHLAHLEAPHELATVLNELDIARGV